MYVTGPEPVTIEGTVSASVCKFTCTPPNIFPFVRITHNEVADPVKAPSIKLLPFQAWKNLPLPVMV